MCNPPNNVYCKIFNGEKCGGVDNNACIKSCGDKILDSVAGEDCDGVDHCTSSCKPETGY